jgi:hypothetical protein
LVKRKQDPGHAGGTLVQLTKKGVTIADEIAITVSSSGMVHDAIASLSRVQNDKSLDYLLKLMDQLSELRQAD